MTDKLKQAIETVKEYLDMDSDVDSEYLNAQRTIINALEAHPTDAVSREAVLNTEYQIKNINDIEYVMLSEVQMKMRKLPPVQPQPCEDVVSRSEAITELTALIENFKGIQGDMGSAVNSARGLIKSLPPVTPQRPKGKWVYKMQTMNNPYTYKCSVCKGWEKDKTKYCPNCGAEMSGGEE